MKVFYNYIILSIFIVGCTVNEPGTGSVIVFTDVIGSYEGQCADYLTSSSELMNREAATLSIFAIDAETAGINASCSRFGDYQINLKSASSSKVIFENNLGNNEIINMTYWSQTDSIVLIHEGLIDNNLIFAGLRK